MNMSPSSRIRKATCWLCRGKSPAPDFSWYSRRSTTPVRSGRNHNLRSGLTYHDSVPPFFGIRISKSWIGSGIGVRLSNGSLNAAMMPRKRYWWTSTARTPLIRCSIDKPYDLHSYADTIPGSANRPILLDAAYVSGKKRPVVIYAHGFNGFKDWGNFDLIARAFAQAGFAFVKFNFSHNGTSPDHPQDFVDFAASRRVTSTDTALNASFYNGYAVSLRASSSTKKLCTVLMLESEASFSRRK